MSKLEVNINSYLSLSEAKEIALTELFPNSPEYVAWNSMDDDVKEVVLIRGTRALETINYIGSRDVSNKLKWPRIIGGNEYTPYEIKLGALLNGLLEYVNLGDKRKQLQKAGVKKIVIGPTTEEYSDKVFKGPVFEEVYMYIRRFICDRAYVI